MQNYFRFLHRNEEVKKHSSSGGAFTAITDSVIQQGGIVYGCILDKNLKTVHTRSHNYAGRNLMRGSKYIQSNISGIFLRVKEDLTAGRLVCFSGTPCEIKALKNYLEIFKIDTMKLLLVEVVCHGVGSNKFFEDYISCLEKKYRGKATEVNFRAKHHKGQKQDMEVRFDNGRVYNASSTKFDWFYSVYLKDVILRPSCYECPFAKQERYADITIADHWGYKDDEAYSLVVCNTEEGKCFVVCMDGDLIKIDKSDVHQPHMEHSCERPRIRDDFWRKYLQNGYLAVQTWIGNNTARGKVKDMAARIIYGLHLAEPIKAIIKRK